MPVEDLVTCLDKQGDPFEVGTCSARGFSCLLDMYELFSPKPASQGLPPADPPACRRWVKTLVDSGYNLLAWRTGRVLGHAAVIPDPARGDGEFLIFVDQDHRNQGIGSALTRRALDHSRGMGLASIWLTVESFNFRAIRLYLKFGFRFCDPADTERLMRIDLKAPDQAHRKSPV
jgi:RimJ/RimL family protein N-acetyltransferase